MDIQVPISPLLFPLTISFREKALLEETQEISIGLKERLSSLRTKSQQTSSQYLAYSP